MYLVGYILLIVGAGLLVWGSTNGSKYDNYALVLALIAFVLGALTLIVTWLA
jgi:hypothetical protein